MKRRDLQKSGAVTDSPPDYELIRILGEGGMGIVYAARQTAVDRQIAIKMIKADFAASDEAQNKFLVEAIVTGDLNHPNIVPIYELGKNDAGQRAARVTTRL